MGEAAHTRSRTTSRLAALGVVLVLSAIGCAAGYPARHEIQSDSRVQIWLSEESQVKVRNAQSRYYDTTDHLKMLESIVATFQDLGFQIEVLDENLGIISGKKTLDAERPTNANLQTYLLYDEESLIVMNRNYRTWGPFFRRSDMVRLTVTIRKRNETQLIVRASAQHYLRPVEEHENYVSFFAALEKSLFAEIVKQKD